MPANALEHVIYKIRNARILEYPFPHFFVENVFPDDFYWDFLASLPSDENYSNDMGSYANRVFAKPDDPDFAPFYDKRFTANVCKTFKDGFRHRFPDGTASLSSEWRLVRDSEGYSIGPHTDAKWKVISLLFYLPWDKSDVDAGTSIYLPKDSGFTCPGGPHYNEQGFEKLWTAPFIPNSCFGFWKTDNSWHGVSEIQRKIRRDVLLFNVYEANSQKQP